MSIAATDTRATGTGYVSLADLENRFPIMEASRRKPGFRGGELITLLDGQGWYFAKPLVRFTFDDADGYETVLSLDGQDDYQKIMDELDAAARSYDPDKNQAEATRNIIRTHLKLARTLLLVNYDLSREELRSLVQFSYADDEDIQGATLMRAVLAVARGDVPKRDGVGSGPPSSSEA